MSDKEKLPINEWDYATDYRELSKKNRTRCLKILSEIEKRMLCEKRETTISKLKERSFMESSSLYECVDWLENTGLIERHKPSKTTLGRPPKCTFALTRKGIDALVYLTAKEYDRLVLKVDGDWVGSITVTMRDPQYDSNKNLRTKKVGKMIEVITKPRKITWDDMVRAIEILRRERSLTRALEKLEADYTEMIPLDPKTYGDVKVVGKYINVVKKLPHTGNELETTASILKNLYMRSHAAWLKKLKLRDDDYLIHLRTFSELWDFLPGENSFPRLPSTFFEPTDEVFEATFAYLRGLIHEFSDWPPMRLDSVYSKKEWYIRRYMDDPNFVFPGPWWRAWWQSLCEAAPPEDRRSPRNLPTLKSDIVPVSIPYDTAWSEPGFCRILPELFPVFWSIVKHKDFHQLLKEFLNDAREQVKEIKNPRNERFHRVVVEFVKELGKVDIWNCFISMLRKYQETSEFYEAWRVLRELEVPGSFPRKKWKDVFWPVDRALVAYILTGSIIDLARVYSDLRAGKLKPEDVKRKIAKGDYLKPIKVGE